MLLEQFRGCTGEAAVTQTQVAPPTLPVTHINNLAAPVPALRTELLDRSHIEGSRRSPPVTCTLCNDACELSRDT